MLLLYVLFAQLLQVVFYAETSQLASIAAQVTIYPVDPVYLAH